ncbi:MAG: hypothetical protein CSA66_07360 [Proteobacteria bacterium]|nr:MAG: hypothetical protein CSA66_07360 [Pseudomonadota bacterium]
MQSKASGAAHPGCDLDEILAVMVAATNWVLTAEDHAGAPSVAQVVAPSAGASAVDKAWHLLLGALNRGSMSSGKALDMELKPSVACNAAVGFAPETLGVGAPDETPPTLFIPQRWPDNFGGLNFGPVYGYQQVELGPRTWYRTFAYDVSGLTSVTLGWRATSGAGLASPAGADLGRGGTKDR